MALEFDRIGRDLLSLVNQRKKDLQEQIEFSIANARLKMDVCDS